MYIKLISGFPTPYAVNQLRRDNPQVSFPQTISDALAAEYGVFPSQTITAPAFDPMTQELTEETPTLADGIWTRQWVVTDLDADTIAAKQMLAVAALQADIVAQTQNRLDSFARTRNYDGILSACTYATSTVPKFQAEGQYCVNARDNTWATLYALMANVQAGSWQMPAGFDDVEPLLPALSWPL